MKSSFWKNSTGASAVSFAIALPTLMTIVGVATDYSVLEFKRTQLQTAADKSAIEAVKELTLSNATTSTVKAAADSYARSNVDTKASTLSVDVTVDAKNGRVDMVLKEEWVPFFAHFISSDVTPIVVNSAAQLSGKMNLCVLALDPTSNMALRMDKAAQVDAKGCAVYVNSKHTNAIHLFKNAKLTAATVCSVGGVKAAANAIKPAPTTDCAVIEDPLASRQPVAQSGCLRTNLQLFGGTQTLTPGRYCGGLKISGNAKVTFAKGEYTIADGAFEISQDAVVTSKNAAFYLKGEAAVLKFTGNSTVAMSGAEEGPMAGFLFFEDRSVSVNRTHRINSANANELTGTIYLPRGKLRVDPNNAVAQNSAFTAIITHQLEVDEGPTLVLNTNYGDTNVPVPTGIRIDTQIVLAN